MDFNLHPVSNLFQITGLPRSGTAFISTMFSLERDCIGLHEEGAENRNWKKTIDDLLLRYEFVADCTTYGFLPKASRTESVKVYLNKDPELSRSECQERFKYEIPFGSFDQLKVIADRWAIENNALVIDAKDLFNISSLKKIWDHCFAGRRLFPEDKVSRLVTMNIQRQNPENVFSIENGRQLIKEVI